jgi:hypothetical protein
LQNFVEDQQPATTENLHRIYNEGRRHSVIANKTPIDVMSRSAVHGQPMAKQAGNSAAV